MALLTRRTFPALALSLVTGALWRKPAMAEQDAPETTVPLAAMASLKPLDPPKPAPDVSFQMLDGTPRTLASYRGKPVVLNFWATWCTPCIAELPELDKLAAIAQDITVLVVSTDHGGAATVSRFLTAHPMNHAVVLLDPQSDIVHQFDVFGFPTTLIIDAHGAIRSRLEGPAAWASGADTIRSLAH